MFSKLGQFFTYLLGKRSEVKDLEKKDLLLAKTVLDIHRTKMSSSYSIIPLFSIKQIHAIDRENAIRATEHRAHILRQSKSELLRKKVLTREVLFHYIPSVSGVKVVKDRDGSYIAFEGNGRLVALQQVFTPSDDMSIEVEEHHFNHSKKILRRMNRVRKYNKLQ